jgi:ferredoxin--NADP+ reductase
VVEKESGVALDPAQTDVFLCGNPDMVQAVKSLLAAKGFKTDQLGKPGTIHVEEYW